MIKHLSILFFFLIGLNTYAQLDSLQIEVNALFDDNEIVFDSTYQLNDAPLNFTAFKFYLSNFSFFQNDSLVYKLSECCHLIDLENPNTKLLSFYLPDSIEYNTISFHLGIDSLTNESGVMGGDLDPMKGMYWSWNTGYINLKLEGNSPLCDNRDHSFQFHLGGYLAPFSNYQSLSFKIDNTADLKLAIDLTELLNSVDLSSNHTTMSPSAEAVHLIKIIANNYTLHHAP